MRSPRIELVVRGRILLAAHRDGLETAEALGIADGRVVATGDRADVPAPAGARVIDAGDATVIPGLTDFHLHLVGLARARESVALDDARDAGEIGQRLAAAADAAPDGGWITGRGWTDAQLADGSATLAAAAGHRRVFLTSHDGHSAWASAAALREAAITVATPDPAGGRIEHGADGIPTGVLRERALDLVARHVSRLQGDRLRQPLDATLRHLASLGITGACEAGDYTDENGIGADAELGDSYSTLTDLADEVDGRLRLSLGIPAAALAAAARRGLRTGRPLSGRRSMRFGWAKHYTDGTLGSSTAALFGPAGEGGILRVTPQQLDADFAAARLAGIALALHAIGDRAVAEVLDAVERAAPRPVGVPRDRMEHVQLLRRSDAGRFERLGVTASIQPIHAGADRDLVEDRWATRRDDAYAWQALVAAGGLLAAGSDAPVESVNPWLGIFAAVHRRLPTDRRADWTPSQALGVEEALAAYTSGPAVAMGVADEGHLRVGARADLAVLTHGLAVVRRADEELGEIRSVLTMVGGVETWRQG